MAVRLDKAGNSNELASRLRHLTKAVVAYKVRQESSRMLVLAIARCVDCHSRLEKSLMTLKGE
jgi:hypothetical protein